MLQGDTRNLPLSNLFQTLALNQQEGVLSVFYRKVERSIAIRGQDVFIISERPNDSALLPQILARLDILTLGEFQNVFSTVPEPRPQGDVLFERHLLSEDQIFGPVREHMFERLFETFLWVGARYKFEVKAIDSDRMLFTRPECQSAMGLPVNSVLMEVARREDEWKRIRERITNVHEVFQLRHNVDSQSFQSPDGLEPSRLNALLAQFNGERALIEILRESEVPEYFVYSTIRALLDEGLVSPITIEEKRDLAERLRNKFQLDRVAEIYRSILAEDSTQTDVRKKLVLQLERKKGDPAELVEHYRALARDAKQNDLDQEQHELLEKLHALAPDDLETLGELAALALESGRDREWHRSFDTYVEAVQKSKAFKIGAETLVRFAELRPTDADLLQQCGTFLHLAGAPREAASRLDEAARLFHAAGEPDRVAQVAERLDQCCPDSAERWRATLGPGKPTKKKRRNRSRRRLVSVAILLLAVVGLGTLVSLELLAFTARADATTQARDLAEIGEVDQAKEALAEFREAYKYSLFSSSTADAEREVALIADRLLGSIQDRPDDLSAAGGSESAAVEAETLLSRAAGFTQRGEYDQALDLYERVDSRHLSRTAANTVTRERERLVQYLNEAKRLSKELRTARMRNDFASASRAGKSILHDYPFSQVAKELKVPVRLRVRPADATVVVQGVIIDGPPYVIDVHPAESMSVRVTRDDFDSFVTTIDPLVDFDSSIRLHRKSELRVTLDASAEARPAVRGNAVFVGTRSGRVFRYSLLDGSLEWAEPLQDLGDVLGAVRVYQDNVVFMGTDGAIYRYADSGELVYREKLAASYGFPSSALSEPSAAGHVYFSTQRGTLVAFDLENRTVAWERALTGGVLSAPCVTPDRLYLTDSQGRVYAVNPENGNVAWKNDVDGEVVTPPVVSGTTLMVGTLDGRLVALETRRGNPRWTRPLGQAVRVPPSYSTDQYVVVTQAGRLTIGSLENGRVHAEADLPGRYSSIGVQVAGSIAHLLNDSGVLTAFNVKQGEECWSYDSGSAPGGSPVIVHDRIVLTGVESGLHVLRVRTGEEPKQ